MTKKTDNKGDAEQLKKTAGGPVTYHDDEYDDELDELASRYVWDEETQTLREIVPRNSWSAARKLTLAFGTLIVLAALVSVVLSGARPMPDDCYGEQSLLSEAGAAEAAGAAGDAAAEADSGAQAPAPEETDDPASYVPAAIVVKGKDEALLASTEAAYELIEAVMSHFSDGLDGEGERTVELMDEVQVLPRPSADSAAIESYDDAFARFTSSKTPIRVLCTFTVSETEIVPFETKTEKDKTLLEGTSIIVSAGREGITTISKRTAYVNGDRSSTRSGTDKQVISAHDVIVRIGAAKITGEDSPGRHEGEKGRDADGLTFISPIDGSVRSNYGERNGVLHLGLDYELEDDSSGDVCASCAGSVVSVLDRGGYGLTIEIDHGDGFATRYAQLASAYVELGDEVTQGQAIAKAGGGDNSEKAALHFELRIDGEAFNPRYYID